MFNYRALFIGMVSFFALSGLGYGQSLDRLFPADVYLVRARALTPSKFEIVHVYVGVSDLKGKSFSGEIYRSTFSLSSPDKKIQIARGELGIWWITSQKDKMELVSYYRRFPEPLDPTTFFPALKGNSKEGESYYKSASEQAEVFEAIYKEGEKGRLAIIDRYVKGNEPLKGVYALSLLRNTKDPKAVQYLVSLSSDESLPLKIQFSLNGLMTLVAAKWHGSKDQLKMLDRWHTGNWREAAGAEWGASNEKGLVYIIAAAAQLGTFSMSERLDLMIKGLSNPARSERFGRELLAEVKAKEKWREGAYKEERRREKEEGFAYLLKRIQEDKTLPARIAAAKLLRLFEPLSPPQQMALRELLKEGRLDKEIKGEIEKVLKAK